MAEARRWGWALTGSGHFFTEALALMQGLDNLDVFVSKAAAEVVRMYKKEIKLGEGSRLIRDTTASAAPVGAFYDGVYHTLVVGAGHLQYRGEMAFTASPIRWPRTSSPRPASAVCPLSCSPATPRPKRIPRPPRAWSRSIRAGSIWRTSGF
jgi:hypothetical protein